MTAKKQGNGRTTAKTAAKKPAAKKPAKKAAPAPGGDLEVYDPRAEFETAAATQYPPFPFRSWDGEQVHELPNPLALDPVEIRAALGLDPTADFAPEDLDNFSEAEMFAMLDNLVPEAWAAIQEMPLGARAALLTRWSEFVSEAVGDEGKGPSQSSPPNRAARRSKRT